MSTQTAVLTSIVIGLGVFLLLYPWTRFWKLDVGWVQILFSLLGFFFIAWAAVSIVEENALFPSNSEVARRLLVAARHYCAGISIGIAGSLAVAGKFKKSQLAPY